MDLTQPSFYTKGNNRSFGHQKYWQVICETKILEGFHTYATTFIEILAALNFCDKLQYKIFVCKFSRNTVN